MEFVDPFRNDTNRYKKLLNDDSPTLESMREDSNIEYAEAQEILNGGTIKGLSPEIYKKAQDKLHELDIDKDKREMLSKAFEQLFSDLNKKYGLNVNLSFDSFSNNLKYIINPVNKKVAEYYLSEAFGRIRVVLYNQFMGAISLIASQILDPKYLLSNSMTYDQKLDTMQRLFEFMQAMNEIYSQVNIPDTDLKLEKVSEDSRPTYDLNSSEVQDFMSSIFNNVKNNSNGLEQK